MKEANATPVAPGLDLKKNDPTQTSLAQPNPEQFNFKLRKFGKLLIPYTVSDKVVSE